jgi:hypothetical protein
MQGDFLIEMLLKNNTSEIIKKNNTTSNKTSEKK